jgi:hypothetical protein
MNRRHAIFIATLAAWMPLAAFAQDAGRASTNAPDGLDRNALERMVRKNIFDPTRVGGRTLTAPRPRAQYFTFCGGAFEGPQAVAFFTGEGSSNKPLKPGDTINGFKVSEVSFKSVKLQGATGAPQVLAMGGSMRREPNGPWKLSEQPEPPPESTDTAVANDTTAPTKPSSANESDIIKKLRARRDDD